MCGKYCTNAQNADREELTVSNCTETVDKYTKKANFLGGRGDNKLILKESQWCKPRDIISLRSLILLPHFLEKLPRL